MSSDHLWHPICSSSFPSLTHLRSSSSAASVPYSKLYSLGRAAALRRLQKPPKPQLSIPNLIFAIDVVQSNATCSRVATVVRAGDRLERDKHGVFRFDINMESSDETASFGTGDGMRVVWNVVLEGYKGVFTMMECGGRGGVIVGLEGWFTKELPAAAGCCGGGGGGMVAEMRLGLREGGGGRVVVERVSVGVLSVVSWRYVCVDDVLRYLQHFLLPCK